MIIFDKAVTIFFECTCQTVSATPLRSLDSYCTICSFTYGQMHCDVLFTNILVTQSSHSVQIEKTVQLQLCFIKSIGATCRYQMAIVFQLFLQNYADRSQICSNIKFHKNCNQHLVTLRLRIGTVAQTKKRNIFVGPISLQVVTEIVKSLPFWDH